MASLQSPPPVTDTFPRTAPISTSNPLGLENFGDPPIGPLKITKKRIRYETPGSVAEDKTVFNAPPNVMKELLPYVAQRWGPEDTSGNNNLCGIYALTAALKNMMEYLGEQVPSWVKFKYLQNQMQSAAFKNSVKGSIRHQLSSNESEIAPDWMTQEMWNIQRQINIEDGVKEAMEEYNEKDFYGIEQLARFLRYLNEKHKVHYRLGVVATQWKARNEKRPPTTAYISEDPNSRQGQHYPVVWLHNYQNTHWESIGPNMSAKGKKRYVSWNLTGNVITVGGNGLYLVETDIAGVEAQYELTASKNQWLYEVTPPTKLGSREGYVYVHTASGPNADAWRVATRGEQDSQDTIRGQEGFVPLEALKGLDNYISGASKIFTWRPADLTKRAGAVHNAKRKRGPEEEATEGPNKRPTVNNAPSTSRNIELDPPPSMPKTITPMAPATPSTNIPPNPAPSELKTITPRPPTTNSINITPNPASNASKTVTLRPANAIQKPIIDTTKMDCFSVPTIPYCEYFRTNPLRLFRVTVPYKAPWVPDFKEGYLSYSPDQILLALDFSFEEDKSRPCRVRNSRGQEGWADPKLLHEIENPFGIHRSRVVKPVSADDKFAYPEDEYPDSHLRSLCGLHAQGSGGPRQDLLDRLRQERDSQGVKLLFWTTKVAGGGFAQGTKIRVEGDPTRDPDAQYVAYGLEGTVSKGVVWGNQLERNPYTWGLRVYLHHCGIPTPQAEWMDKWFLDQRKKAEYFHACSLQKFPQTVRPPGSVPPVGPPTFGFGSPGQDLGSIISPRLQAFVQSVPGTMAPPPTQSGGQRTNPLQQPVAPMSERSKKIVQDMIQPAQPWTGPPPPPGVLPSFWKDHLHKKGMEEGEVEEGGDYGEENEYHFGDPWESGDDLF